MVTVLQICNTDIELAAFFWHKINPGLQSMVYFLSFICKHLNMVSQVLYLFFFLPLTQFYIDRAQYFHTFSKKTLKLKILEKWSFFTRIARMCSTC